MSDSTVKTPAESSHLLEVLYYWVKTSPNKELLRFYPQGELEENYESRSFIEFYQNISQIAKSLEAYHGQQAILFYQSGISFLEALFACFMAGVVAVPAYAPRRNQNVERIVSLLDNCEPAIILSSTRVMEQSRKAFEQSIQQSSSPLKNQHLSLPWLCSDEIDSNNHTHQQNIQAPPALDPHSLAFLQYTSGSTGQPKGVMVSHHNLIYNLRMAENNFKLPSDTRCISWLPLFHDMGLIGAVMMPMYWGAGSWLMPPAAFLQKPLRWLNMISEAGKSSHVASAAPNFAYQLCIDQINEAQLEAIDLSNWTFALNGSEPVRSETVSKFIEKFGQYGFPETAMGPSYGMAECTLLASTRRHKPLASINVNSETLAQDKIELYSENPQSNTLHQSLQSSGSSCTEQDLAIVNSNTFKPCEEGEVGEIWLKGEHIAQGYFRQEALSQECFQAYTSNQEGPYLRTGDRGAIINQELYITGRIKDMLVIRGRNIYPQDIEHSASRSFDALQVDSAAAFSIPNAETLEEELVIVQEVARAARKNFDGKQAALAIRQAVAKEQGVEVKHIAFIRFASIAKTSSGKIQRQKCRSLYLSQGLSLEAQWDKQEKPSIVADNFQQLPLIAEFNPEQRDNFTTELSLYIQQFIATRLQCKSDDISLSAPLDSTGLDSVDIIHLASELENWGQQRLEHSLFFDCDNIDDLSQQLVDRLCLEKSNTPSEAQESDKHADIEGFL